jgi:hypothetical protein
MYVLLVTVCMPSAGGKIWDCALPELVWSGWAAALTGAYAE